MLTAIFQRFFPSLKRDQKALSKFFRPICVYYELLYLCFSGFLGLKCSDFNVKMRYTEFQSGFAV